MFSLKELNGKVRTRLLGKDVLSVEIYEPEFSHTTYINDNEEIRSICEVHALTDDFYVGDRERLVKFFENVKFQHYDIRKYDPYYIVITYDYFGSRREIDLEYRDGKIKLTDFQAHLW